MSDKCLELKQSIFRNKNFSLLMIGQLISDYGDFLYYATILWIATDITNDPLKISIINVFETIPGIIFGIFIGALIDRLNKKKILVWTDFFRGITIIILILLYLAGSLLMWHIYIATFILATNTRFFSPTRLSIIPTVIPEKRLQKANSYSTMINNTMKLCGNASAGFLYGIFGAFMALGINALSFIVSGFCIFFIRLNDPLEKKEKKKINFSDMLNEIKMGFIYLKKKPILIKYLSISLSLNIAFATLILVPLFLKTTLNTGIMSYGLVEGFSAGFMILTSVILGIIHIKKRYLIMISTLFITAISFACMAVTNTIWIFGIARILMSVMLIIFNILFVTEFQKHVSAEYRGRLFTISYLFSSILYPISSMVAGSLAKHFSISFVWIGVCFLLVIVSLIMFLVRDKQKSVERVRNEK